LVRHQCKWEWSWSELIRYHFLLKKVGINFHPNGKIVLFVCRKIELTTTSVEYHCSVNCKSNQIKSRERKEKPRVGEVIEYWDKSYIEICCKIEGLWVSTFYLPLKKIISSSLLVSMENRLCVSPIEIYFWSAKFSKSCFSVDRFLG
jgi:hypothetical protein